MLKVMPDVLGMKMPAAASLLDAAGVSYNTEFLRPTRGENSVKDGEPRVIRQKRAEDGTLLLSVCLVPDGKTEEADV